MCQGACERRVRRPACGRLSRTKASVPCGWVGGLLRGGGGWRPRCLVLHRAMGGPQRGWGVWGPHSHFTGCLIDRQDLPAFRGLQAEAVCRQVPGRQGAFQPAQQQQRGPAQSQVSHAPLEQGLWVVLEHTSSNCQTTCWRPAGWRTARSATSPQPRDDDMIILTLRHCLQGTGCTGTSSPRACPACRTLWAAWAFKRSLIT